MEDIHKYLISGLEEENEFAPIMTLEEDDDNKKVIVPEVVPIVPLRNTVLFPGVVIPITVGRDKSIKAVKEAWANDKIIGVSAQLDVNTEEPEFKDIYQIGTIAKILRVIKMPDGSTTAIIQGKTRFKVEEPVSTDPYFKAKVHQLVEIMPDEKDSEYNAMISSIKDMASKVITLSPNIPSEASIVLKNIESNTFLLNFISNNLHVDLKEKQSILEEPNLKIRADKVLKQLQNDINMLELKNQIQSKVRTDIEKQQRDYFLHQQIKTIQEELGGDPNSLMIKNLRDRALKKMWNKDVREHFNKELSKLERMNAAAAEYTVLHNYLELLLDLPWDTITKDKFDIKRAKKILDAEHYGMDKIKERILEYLAVLKLKGDLKSPILCFVGPPGVGKTSLGKSIAKALSRKYVRVALGGLHDEAEIRGHRRTYIGAMPGKIINAIKKAQSSNPVFVLDEIDKVGNDHRGDPSSALLEVLDPEQNSNFTDNYVELEYDLSKVMFIATANSLSTIQAPLRDRMEIIELSGYSIEEKIEIAKRHLIPKERDAHGVTSKMVDITDEALVKIIEDYTRESGVRDLSRKLASIMRNVAKEYTIGTAKRFTIKAKEVEKILGARRFDKDIYTEKNPAGVAVGLAWTSVGGEILFIETLLSKGKGMLKLTGNLGDVMKESAATALSFIKAHATDLGIKAETLEKNDFHIHVPEGATPKDGPSAGVTMLSSLASAFSGIPIKPFLAMTGEITLRGKVLPVGGIKEKMLAAKRAGMKEILLCYLNEKDILEIQPEFIKGLKFHYVYDMKDVLKIALQSLKQKS
jgi:ATP-dependent Lon protease